MTFISLSTKTPLDKLVTPFILMHAEVRLELDEEWAIRRISNEIAA